MTDFLVASGLSAATVVLVMAGVWIAARRTGKAAVVDVAWGPGFALVALVCVVLAPHALSWLLFVLVAVWGLRLGWHIGRRSRGHGEDPRYEQLLSGGGGLVRKVLLPQGAAMWFVSLPVQAAAAVGGSLHWLVWVGVAVWAFGLAFEAVGDAQLAAYKRDPDRGPVMDRGLWGWTRHPNYFGDAVVWWGIWIAAVSVWTGSWWVLLTVLSPIAMTHFIRNVTGAKLLERTMMKRPGYPEYAARVPMFLPRPPR